MKNWLRENRGFVLFLALFGVFRLAVADWNPIPSGSMRPNLLEGDVVFVNRLAYDLKLPLTDRVLVPLGEPQRGDIVTFSSPKDGVRLIKRVIGVPGDTVEMRERRLIINGQPASYAVQAEVLESVLPAGEVAALRLDEQTDRTHRTVQWLAVSSDHDHFGPLTVPAGQYLMLGDNRDNSADSRYIGLVPRHLLVGRAERLLVSADILGNWLPRWDRFGQSLR